jgi:hypothetical protein
MSGHDFATCQPSPPHPPSSGHARVPGSHARGLLALGKHHGSQVLRKQRHLMSGTQDVATGTHMHLTTGT